MFRFAPSLFAAAVLACVGSVQAVSLNNSFVAQPILDTALPGTTTAARPELAGTVLQDVVSSFSFGALDIFGTVQNRVVRETGTGTLDFYWRILIDPASTGGGISAFRLIDFSYANLTDADWSIDSVGANGPAIARLFNPASDPEGAINFLFYPSVAAGDAGSNFFFLHTSATNYALTANYDLLGGPHATLSNEFQTFAPAAVPEPSVLAMLGLGLAALGAAKRRRERA